MCACQRERERLVNREGLIERKKWEDKESVYVFLESKVWRVCFSECVCVCERERWFNREKEMVR